MLVLRTLLFRMSAWKGKLSLVALGVRSAHFREIPQTKIYKKNSVSCFRYKGKLNGKECSFLIDSDSDVFIINRKFKKKIQEGTLAKKIILRYPTRKKDNLQSCSKSANWYIF